MAAGGIKWLQVSPVLLDLWVCAACGAPNRWVTNADIDHIRNFTLSLVDGGAGIDAVNDFAIFARAMVIGSVCFCPQGER